MKRRAAADPFAGFSKRPFDVGAGLVAHERLARAPARPLYYEAEDAYPSPRSSLDFLNSPPTLMTCFLMSSMFKYFVNMSAGFSFPRTL